MSELCHDYKCRCCRAKRNADSLQALREDGYTYRWAIHPDHVNFKTKWWFTGMRWCIKEVRYNFMPETGTPVLESRWKTIGILPFGD